MKSKTSPKFEIGQEVKADTDGSIVFTKVVGVEIEKNQIYYTLENLNYTVEEDYIRPLTEVDKKFKALESTYVTKESEFRSDRINREFWKSQVETLRTSWNYLQNFFIPYLKENNFVLPLEKMNDWDSNYRETFSMKNAYVFLIEHSTLDIMVIKNSTHVTLYVLAPFSQEDGYPSQGSMPRALWGFQKYLSIYSYCVKYSDDDIVQILEDVTREIIKGYESPKDGYYFIHPDYEVVDKLEEFNVIFEAHEYGSLELPGSAYTYALRDIDTTKYYLFGFEN